MFHDEKLPYISEKLEGKGPLRRPWSRWDYNIEGDLK
jgi:hypothetical protein